MRDTLVVLTVSEWMLLEDAAAACSLFMSDVDGFLSFGPVSTDVDGFASWSRLLVCLMQHGAIGGTLAMVLAECPRVGVYRGAVTYVGCPNVAARG